MTTPCLRFFKDYLELGEFLFALLDMFALAEWDMLGELEAHRGYEFIDGDWWERPTKDVHGGLHVLEGMKAAATDTYDYYLRARDYFVELAGGPTDERDEHAEADIHALAHLEALAQSAEDFYFLARQYFGRGRDMSQFDALRREQIAWYESRRQQLNGLEGIVLSGLLGSSRLLVDVALGRVVDNFISYLEELRDLMFGLGRQTTRPGEKIVAFDVLRQRRAMEPFYATASEEEIEKALKTNWNDLTKLLKKTFDFSLYEPDTDRELVRVIKEYRNIIVHNRGVVDRRLTSRRSPESLQRLGLSKDDVKEGEQLKRDLRRLARMATFLAHRVRDIDMRTAERFSLPRPQSRPNSQWDVWDRLPIGQMTLGTVRE